MNDWTVIGIALVSALTGAGLAGALTSRKMRRKVEYMLDALEDRETAFRFDENRLFSHRYHHTLNRIRTLFEREKEEIKEQEHYYGQMLDQVRTAIVVIDRSPRREGRILYQNAAALRLLGIATFSHVRQLNTVSEELERLFDTITAGQEQRCSYYNERGKLTLSLTATEARLQGKAVKIMVFNDVTEEAAQHEDLSWNKLIRVLTHEIMNTVTPIASLSHSLSQDLQADSMQSPDRSELQTGLDTISESANGLITFVNNYRKLTRVATPQKTPFYVRELIEQVKQLVITQTAEAHAELTYTEKSDDILLYADVHQIGQILVNLIRNALQAGATRIDLTAEIDFAEAVVIEIYNNGRPIERENQEEIFVPFYTTKQEGTGIGLSLSRQMMRLHNGTLDLVRSDEKGTLFRMVFR